MRAVRLWFPSARASVFTKVSRSMSRNVAPPGGIAIAGPLPAPSPQPPRDGEVGCYDEATP